LLELAVFNLVKVTFDGSSAQLVARGDWFTLERRLSWVVILVTAREPLILRLELEDV
jgi:hypothetical protein